MLSDPTAVQESRVKKLQADGEKVLDKYQDFLDSLKVWAGRDLPGHGCFCLLEPAPWILESKHTNTFRS